MPVSALPEVHARCSIPVHRDSCLLSLLAALITGMAPSEVYKRDILISWYSPPFTTPPPRQGSSAYSAHKETVLRRDYSQRRGNIWARRRNKAEKKAKKSCFREKCNVLMSKVSCGLFTTLLVSLKMFLLVAILIPDRSEWCSSEIFISNNRKSGLP